MNAFQMITLPILALLFLERLVALGRGRSPRRVVLFWAVVWLGAGVCVAHPGVTVAIARPLGIARGADLVSYCAVLFMFVGFWMTYLRLRRLEMTVTQLVRQMAIQNPMRGEGEKARTGE